MKNQDDNQRNNNNLRLIVGIGASAGGLAAFSELLNHLPADTGMAFVLVQHLAPAETSLLGELLARTTPIPVKTAENGISVQANHAYVIPPNTQMTISQGRLELAECDQSQPRVKTIDLFFQSLAADQQNQGIAVILSGSNNDGAQGIQAVRAAGGITFAQTPSTAEFPNMPQASISTGQVDCVLPPAKIAEELVKISHHPYLLQPRGAQGDDSALQGNNLSIVFRLLQKQTGVDFANYKPTTFQRRMQRRMALHKLPDLAEYVQYLQETPSEIQALCQDVLITVTRFFRDIDSYDVLTERVFPTLLQQPSAAASIRIWVPGCATGEEVYSLAMCLLECLSSLVISPTIQIFGTDISEQAIEEARLGKYPENRMEGVSPERRRRFFTEDKDGYQLNKSVRELCVFARQDLSSDPPFSELDLVSCRNVLIYFQPSLQRRILSIFHYSLKPTGFLLLGNSEGAGNSSDLFDVLDVQSNIYTRKAVPTPLNLDFVTAYYRPQETASNQPPAFPTGLSRSNVQQWADQIVLNRYAPVGVIVNEQLEILQFRGETSPYLKLPQGEPSFNLLKMIRPSLLIDVRAALEAAKQQNIAIQRQQLQMADVPAREISLEVIPFNISRPQGRCFLVLFERSTPEMSLLEAEQKPDIDDDLAEVYPDSYRLQQELLATHQELLDTQTSLRLTIEEKESTTQQLMAANEEILSSNEELKSTNEELQTAKEEIQSSNEELQTTNEELQHRNVESRRAHDDLINLLNNVNIPVLMLSNDLCIRRFTPRVRGLFNLIPSDIGRPVKDIRCDLDSIDLETLVTEVLETLNTAEREVQDREGHWHLLRIRPYRTVDNKIDGVVVVLIDIDPLKQTEQDLRASQSQLETELLAMSQVQTLSHQLFTSLDLNRAMNEVLTAAMTVHDANLGCLQLYDSARNDLDFFVQQGFGPAFLEHFQSVQGHEGSTYSQALNQQQRVLIEDVQLDSAFAPYRQIAADAGFQAVQSTPLMNRQGELLGILSTHFPQPYSPTERELRLLDLYARQAADYIDLIRAVEIEKQALLEREQAAQSENKRKDEFLSVLSHELRTPLTSILGWAEFMETETLDEAKVNFGLSSIQESSSILLRLIEDLLDASRLTEGRFQVELQPTQVTDLLQQVVSLLRPQVNEKGIHLEMALESSAEPLAVDPDRMKQAFSNLLSNAIKFTPNEGRILLRLTYSSSQVQVQVRDTGRGIAPDELPHIFNRFRQIDASNTRRTSGLGLGLYLAHSIVEAHGGTLEAESQGEGQGSTFTLTLPKTVSYEAPAQPPASIMPAINLSLEGLRILLVEDSGAFLFLMTTYLQSVGAVVSNAQSASEALEIITTQPLDILVSDIGLPDVNGYELMQQVRALPPEQGGTLPAIALTDYVAKQDSQAAMQAGFQCHLIKPIGLKALLEAVYNLWESVR